MKRIRTWQDIVDLAKEDGKTPEEWLTPAEQEMIAAAMNGEVCTLENGELPPEVPEGDSPSPTREIRAEVLRYMLLGGCAERCCDSEGVFLRGAHISGTLNIAGQTLIGVMYLQHCRFENTVDAVLSRVAELSLEHSRLEGLNAQGIKTKGSVFLRSITANATVDVNSAEIGGQLACENANFLAKSGKALNAQEIKTKESVFLSSITAHATVDMNSAEIGGQLACGNANFLAKSGKALNAQGIKTKGDVFLRAITANATVALNGAKIGGQLSCINAKFLTKDDHALNAQGMHIKQGLFWGGDIEVGGGPVDFNTAHAAVLVDDPSKWLGAEKIDLDHFTYDQIIGGPTDPKSRLPWLKAGSTTNRGFTPQPYTHFANVLEQMGKSADARTIRYHRDIRLA